MKLFVLKDDVFVESPKLYLHDVAVVVDERGRRVFFWRGSRVSKEKLATGTERFAALRRNPTYSGFQFFDSSEVLDPALSQFLKRSLGEQVELARRRVVKSRLLLSALSLVGAGVLFSAFGLFNLVGSLGTVPPSDGMVAVATDSFTLAFSTTRAFTLVALVAFLGAVLSAAALRDEWLAVTGVLSTLTTLGWYLYLRFDVYLFDTLKGTVGYGTTWLDSSALATFFIANAAVLILASVPVTAVLVNLMRAAEVERRVRDVAGDSQVPRLGLKDRIRPHERRGTPKVIDLRKSKTAAATTR
ncbi:MAG: hypothetical protein Kow0069_07220 [Promethearchaeota archaeon]